MNQTGKLRFSCGSFVRTIPLLDRRVPVSGFELDIVPDPFPSEGILEDYQARRNVLMTDERAFDVSEMGLAPLVAARSRGHDLLAIPVFHYRRFRHSAIVCRTKAKIRRPEDLIGKRVGVRRFSLSAGIWGRGLLQHEFGLPLDRVRWIVQTEIPLRSEVRERLDVTVLPPNPPLENLLLSGELDATIEAFHLDALRNGSPEVHTLFENPLATELASYQRTGVFPIMHTIVMRRPLIEKYPDLPRHLHAAFVQAKAVGASEPRYNTRYVLAEEEREWLDSLAPADRAAFVGDDKDPRDPWKYSLREDRKTVETFLDYAFEQGLTERRFGIEELFVEDMLNV